MQSPPARPSTAELTRWITTEVASYLDRSPEQVDPAQPLAEQGVDSVIAITLCGDIEQHLGVVLDVALVWEYPTIDSMVAHLLTNAGGER